LILGTVEAGLWKRRLMRVGELGCGALLLGATDRAIGLIDRFAACFHDERRED